MRGGSHSEECNLEGVGNRDMLSVPITLHLKPLWGSIDLYRIFIRLCGVLWHPVLAHVQDIFWNLALGMSALLVPVYLHGNCNWYMAR